jgi:hypothetical protein
MEVPQKFKTEVLYETLIPLLGIHSKECIIRMQIKTLAHSFIAILFTTAKLWKQPRCPTTDRLYILKY